jgi:hypothetical protein
VVSSGEEVVTSDEQAPVRFFFRVDEVTATEVRGAVCVIGHTASLRVTGGKLTDRGFQIGAGSAMANLGSSVATLRSCGTYRSDLPESRQTARHNFIFILPADRPAEATTFAFIATSPTIFGAESEIYRVTVPALPSQVVATPPPVVNMPPPVANMPPPVANMPPPVKEKSIACSRRNFAYEHPYRRSVLQLPVYSSCDISPAALAALNIPSGTNTRYSITPGESLSSQAPGLLLNVGGWTEEHRYGSAKWNCSTVTDEEGYPQLYEYPYFRKSETHVKYVSCAEDSPATWGVGYPIEYDKVDVTAATAPLSELGSNTEQIRFMDPSLLAADRSISCQVSDWSMRQWPPAGVACGTTVTRTRTITRMSSRGPSACPALSDAYTAPACPPVAPPEPPKIQLTLTSSTCGNAQLVGTGMYAQGATANIEVRDIPADKVFSNWNIPPTPFVNAQTITLGSTNAVVIATCVNRVATPPPVTTPPGTVRLTLSSTTCGARPTLTGAGNYPAGTAVNVNISGIPSTMEFVSWTTGSMPNRPQQTVTVSADAEVVAICQTKASQIVTYQCSLRRNTPDYTATMAPQRVIPLNISCDISPEDYATLSPGPGTRVSRNVIFSQYGWLDTHMYNGRTWRCAATDGDHYYEHYRSTDTRVFRESCNILAEIRQHWLNLGWREREVYKRYRTLEEGTDRFGEWAAEYQLVPPNEQ